MRFTLLVLVALPCLWAAPVDVLTGDDYEDFVSKTSDSDFDATPSQPDIRYVLYTRKNPENYQVLNLTSKEEFEKSNFDYKKPTKILVFGWHSGLNAEFTIYTREAYMIGSDSNVIVLDWSPIAQWNYIEASRVVRLIGDFLTQALGLLFDYGVDPESVHLVGHSLGAHIVGLGGKNSPVQLPRVTGLDPAGPLFSLDSPYRISNESARFVDIMHTCGEFMGFYEELGHVDFYPNGGKHSQPGCGWDLKGWCSHHRAYWFFAESVANPAAFPAIKCNSWSDFNNGKCANATSTYMGESVSHDARGKYFLKTNQSPPYRGVAN